MPSFQREARRQVERGWQRRHKLGAGCAFVLYARSWLVTPPDSLRPLRAPREAEHSSQEGAQHFPRSLLLRRVAPPAHAGGAEGVLRRPAAGRESWVTTRRRRVASTST